VPSSIQDQYSTAEYNDAVEFTLLVFRIWEMPGWVLEILDTGYADVRRWRSWLSSHHPESIWKQATSPFKSFQAHSQSSPHSILQA